MENVISVSQLTKIFRKRKETGYFSKKRYDYIKALDNVTFDVRKGDSVAIIGKNGSGKSTLLKILMGVYPKTSGEVKINGAINGLLETSIAFHKELNGYDNIIILGKILGLSLKEIKNRIDEVVDFAELKDFLYMPLKHYSNGMISRLVFSTVILSKEDILVFDEVFAFGDVHFQQKAFQFLKQQNNHGKTLLVVSHHIMALITLCNEYILLSNGKLITKGTPNQVIPLYYENALSSSTNFIEHKPGFILQSSLSLFDVVLESISYIFEGNLIRITIQLKNTQFEPSDYDIGILLRDIAGHGTCALSLMKNLSTNTTKPQKISFLIKKEFINIHHLFVFTFIFHVKTKEYKLSPSPLIIKIEKYYNTSSTIDNLYTLIGFINIPVEIELN